MEYCPLPWYIYYKGENQMCKVSVIVPVYNVENYLERCLKSILAQTLEDIEIICIDDGSTDCSGELLDFYASMDARIRVTHRENAGYGAAMNAGLDMALGEFIGIVESDDCIAEDMYETLYRTAQQHQLDMVKSDVYYWMEHLEYLRGQHIKNLDFYYNKVLQEADRNIFFCFFMNIWTGIYRRDFLERNHIRFQETAGASYQDNGFWMQTCLYADRAMWIDKAFYYYRQDNLEASVKDKGKIMAMTKEYEYIEALLKQRGEERFLPYCYSYRLFRLKGTFYRISDACKRDFCNQIKSDYMKYMAYIKDNAAVDRWLREAVKNPDAVCSRVIGKKDEIKRRLESCGNIIIYGAGNRGDMVFRGLYNEGYYQKIACFAVSENAQNDRIAGKDVVLLKDAVTAYRDCLVIVAVIRGSRMYCQMVDNLTALGIDSYMDGTDIEENFYII